jgi:3-oxoacyl-(acyl-carrier-protein) synthase
VIVVTGAASVALGPGDAATLEPTEYLRSRKTRKFMGTQDDLAVVAAARALQSAELGGEQLGERAGLFAVVGYIPFNRHDIDPVLAKSLDGDHFSMERFSSGGFQQAHPLLTFRCLPNMPAFHVSANFDIQGPYFVTYPGPGQAYSALTQACNDLAQNAIDFAVVLAVAHQRNFLVEHHFSRLTPKTPASELWDAGACLILERDDGAHARGVRAKCILRQFDQSYAHHDPLEVTTAETESLEGAPLLPGARGPAGLFGALTAAIEAGTRGKLVHRLRSRDQVTAESTWEICG